MTIVSAVGVNAAPAARVTVAIAFLDEMRFLADAVDEVRRQTLEAWRLILVDDGSTGLYDGLACGANEQNIHLCMGCMGRHPFYGCPDRALD